MIPQKVLRIVTLSTLWLAFLCSHVLPADVARTSVPQSVAARLAPAVIDNDAGAAVSFIRVPKQVGNSVSGGKDNAQSETGYHGFGGGGGGGGGGGMGGGGGGMGGSGGAGMHGDSKYFQQDGYLIRHSPHEYELGHVQESSDGDWEERYERVNDALGVKQGKVKWGDKYAGYGEHYWDYNHADKSHHGGDGGGGGGGGGGGDGGGGGGGGGSGDGYGYGHYGGQNSDPVPTYDKPAVKSSSVGSPSASSYPRQHPSHKYSSSGVKKRHSQSQSQSPENVELEKVGPAEDRKEVLEAPALVLDPATGMITDESTGRSYWLKPISLTN